MVRELMDWSVLVVGFVGDIFLRLIITAVVLYYLLKHDTRLSNWATNNFGTLTPQWTRYWKRVDEDLSNIYFGNILNGIIAMVIAIIIALVYSFFAPDPIDIPYPVLFGIIAGISSLIPIIGVKIAYIPVTLYISGVAYTTDATGLFPYVIIFVVFCVVILDFLQDLLIRPYISGKNLHIGLLLIAYIAGPLMLGWYGFFFAPILLVLIYHFSDLILPDIIAEWF
jgi:predicted PurR-regulated permease PerM